jgi:ABC-type glycerol-3-phosphate transport system substrate-binding protein
MKRFALISAIGPAAALVLAGCGSMPSTPVVQQRGASEIDFAKMARVERAAEASGVKVVWIQPPRKAVHSVE